MASWLPFTSKIFLMAFQWPLNKLLGLLIRMINNRFPFHGQFHGQAAHQGQAVLSATSRGTPAETPSLSSIPGNKGQDSFPQFLRAELNSVIAMGKILEEGLTQKGRDTFERFTRTAATAPVPVGTFGVTQRNNGTTMAGNSLSPCSQGKLLWPLLSHTSSGFITAFHLKQSLCRWVKSNFLYIYIF